MCETLAGALMASERFANIELCPQLTESPVLILAGYFASASTAGEQHFV